MGKAGGYPKKAAIGSVSSAYGKAVGAGAAAPVVTADGDRQMLQPTGAATGAPTRTGVGVYTVTIKDRFLPLLKLLAPDIHVVGTTLLDARVEAFNLATGLITFRTFTAAGVATEMAAADTAFFSVDVQESTQG